MMTPKTQTIVASSIIALTAAVALTLISKKPEASATVLITMGVFIIVWNTTKHLSKRKCPDTDWLHSKVRHEILFAIILASLLLLGSTSATLAKELELFDSDLVKRIVGVNIGLMLMILGNYMPKKITGTACSCSAGCATPRKSSSTQRFVGWLFVLAGLIYAAIWIFVDLDHTSLATLFSFPAAIVVIIIVRMFWPRSPRPDRHLGSHT